MEKIIETLIERCLKEVLGEGERRVRLEALHVCVETVRGARKVFLIAYLLCFSCFLSALSFFSTGYLAVEDWHGGRALATDPLLVFCFGLWVCATALLALMLRERRWTEAFRLQERIDALERSSRDPGSLSEAELVLLIEKILDQKLKKTG